ncbi:MAG: family 16 glycoside hydrolase [Planctomycetota bacterium]|jgi:HEAT repeat protein/type 1 glutamine amidotransferase
MKRYLTILALCMLACTLFIASPADVAGAEKWEKLFDGKTLNGWIQRNGKAKYEVVDGTIVGTTVLKTPNSFLCTEKMYTDFILEVEFLADPGINSGIQIRSHSHKNYKDGRVHGYQVEIDTSKRAWSGGIYDEARRGWLNNLKDNPKAQKAFKNGKWNHYRIEAVRNRIRTWVNGVAAADLNDSMTAKGFISLQVHGSKTAGNKIRWRNIRIKDLTGTARPELTALIVDGQNNHSWKTTTPPLKALLEETGIFQVDVATSPSRGKPMDSFKPEFARYDVVVMNYTGDDWPDETNKALVDYMNKGGGLVIFHAADNAFPKWKEYNEMIAIGGWGGRNEKSGPMVRWKNNKMVLDNSPGRGGTHGPQHAFQLITRDRHHPIMAGLPEKWMHSPDELYSKLRGPAKNMKILATAYADPAKRGTGEHEPALFTISYGKGRVFHTVLGHGPKQLKSVGFIVTYQRGTEWAATGRVTQVEVPADFPTADTVSLRMASDAMFKEIESYDFGKSRKALAAIEEQIRNTPKTGMSSIEIKLLAALNSPSSFAAKQFVCRVLRRIGSARSVPALAKWLHSRELSHMARFALQHMPALEAGDALRKALDSLSGNLKVGVVGSIGQRGDAKAVPQLGRLIRSSDKTLAAAAITALGRIGGQQATEILGKTIVPKDLRRLKENSYLLCADKMLAQGKTEKATKIYLEMSDSRNIDVKIAACTGLVSTEKEKMVTFVLALLKDKNARLRQAAGKLIVDMPGTAATKAFAQQLESLKGDAQVVLLSALESRADKAAAPFIAKLAAKGDDAVRLAAVNALAVVGDASNVNQLAKLSTEQGALGKAALDSLSRLTGPGVTKSLSDVARKKGDSAVRVNAIQTLVTRREVDAMGVLLTLARDADTDVRQAVFRAMRTMAGQRELPVIVSLLLEAKDASDLAGIERALTAIVARVDKPDPAPIVSALAKASNAQRPRLLAVLARIGDEKSLAAVRAQLKSTDAETKKAAIRALADWPDPKPLSDLLNIAKKRGDAVDKALALRGYIKLVGLPANRSAADTVKLLEGALGLTGRADEKRAIVAVLPNYPCPEATKLAERLRGDPAVAAEAALAISKIKQITVNKSLKATASRNNGNARNALDGNKGSRWDTGTPQVGGEWFTIDLGIESTLTGITLDAAGSRGDYPRGYEVYVSFDGGNWGKPVTSGKGTKPLTEIKFPRPVRARFIRIVQTGSVSGLFWSIHDLKIHI